MTAIKLCGLTAPEDITAANRLQPDYIGFVFWEKSKRCVSVPTAQAMKSVLSPMIQAVGVFVDAPVGQVADLLNRGIIDVAQLHGHEDAVYLEQLRTLTDKPLWQAFRIHDPQDIIRAEASTADLLLLDAGAGEGTVFDWTLLRTVTRPYFLAGGLNVHNVAAAIRQLHPYGVDVSSGIETDGHKDGIKMAAFVAAARARKEEEA